MKQVLSIEVSPVVIEDGDVSMCSPEEASDFGVYVRVQEGESAFAYWVADFPSLEGAESLAASLAKALDVPVYK